MSDVTLLRKLTEKSTLKFGVNSDVPIYQLIALKDKSYLVWVYFNCSKITFVDEILDQLNIPVEFRIQKPGCSKESHQLFLDSKEKPDGLFAKILKQKTDKKLKAKRVQQRLYLKKFEIKNFLTRKNHGH